MRHIMYSAALCAVLLTTPALGQLQNADERKPDAGNPAVPLNPPGVIAPINPGNGIGLPSADYMGRPPITGGTFTSPPGFLPVPRDDINRPFDRAEGRTEGRGVTAILPPASTGRQGLPPQTWALLTPRQQELHRQSETAAMSSDLGEGFVWDDAGRRGEVWAVGERLFNNRPCRDYSHVVQINGQRVTGQTTICR
jgi:hypothetical protein